MANHKSAIKRLKQNEKKNFRNKIIRSAFRTAVKKVENLAEEVRVGKGDGDELRSLFVSAERLLASAATKGIIHKKTASRKVSRLSKRVKDARLAGQEAAAAAS